MNINLSPELERFAKRQAKARGLANVGDYIEELLGREWKQQLQERLDVPDRAALRRLLREGAVARAERDRALAEEWFFLEEEAYDTSQTRRAQAG